MSVISVAITESSSQIVSGIPKSVILTANVPAYIYYTLDGTEPNTSSNIYVSTIYLPTDQQTVILKVFATNGVDSSPIITETYQTDILNNLRLPHSTTDVRAGENIPDLYPYGTNPIQPLGKYVNPSGVTVDDPSLTQISTGYDGEGDETGFTNKPYNLENYDIVYSDRNYQGEYGRGIGNLPAEVDVEEKPSVPEESSQFTNLFNPRAFVIFQDLSEENPEDPTQINKQFFCLENFETVRDGAELMTSGMSPSVMGSFVKAYHNPKDNTITYYYFDSHACRWIISKSPYVPTGGFDGDLSGVKFSRNSKAVFEWVPFSRRVLF